MTQEAIRKALEKAGLPVPVGQLLDARWVAASGDWYVETPEGWFPPQGSHLEILPYGPTY